MATQTGSYDFKSTKAAKETAEKVATNFVATDSLGMMVYDGTSGTHTPTNPGANTSNVLIDSNSVDIRQGTNVLATFGTTTRIGQYGAENVTINSDGISINTSILSTAVNMKAEVVDEETSGIISFGDVYDSGNENAPVVGGYCNQEEAMLKLIGKSLDGMTEGGVQVIATGPDVGNGETYSGISVSGLGGVMIEGHDGSDDSYIQLTPGAIYIDSSNIKLDDNSFKIAGSRDFYVQNRITQGAHPASTDFDDYMKTGLYLCPGMTDHRPATVSSWVLICIFNNAGSSGVQLAVSTGASYLYKRSYSNSTWSAWTRVQFATYTNP